MITENPHCPRVFIRIEEPETCTPTLACPYSRTPLPYLVWQKIASQGLLLQGVCVKVGGRESGMDRMEDWEVRQGDDDVTFNNSVHCDTPFEIKAVIPKANLLLLPGGQ